MNRVPDRIGYITGLRGWRLMKPGYLASSSQDEIWIPGEPTKAFCRMRNYHKYETEQERVVTICETGVREDFVARSVLEPAPAFECSCGVYAIAQVTTGNTFHTQSGAVGEIALWGKVITHETGYRAEYAYPLSLGIRTSRYSNPDAPEIITNAAKMYGVRLLAPDEVETLIEKYTLPPEPPVCPLCKPERHLIKDCPNPMKDEIVKRAMRDIEYRRNYYLRRKGRKP